MHEIIPIKKHLSQVMSLLQCDIAGHDRLLKADLFHLTLAAVKIVIDYKEELYFTLFTCQNQKGFYDYIIIIQ